MRPKITKFPINFESLIHLTKLVYKNKSPLRIFHNFFLKSVAIEGKTIDLGSGNHSSYYKFLNLKDAKIYSADQHIQNKDNHYLIDLEKKLDLSNEDFDTVILFNVIEHIENYKLLLSEINRILKKNGKLELFVPFMFRYHEDPKDIFRPTHYYIASLLEKAGFEVNTFLVGVGPIKIISEIILKYLKINFLRTFFLIFLLLIDRIINFFSKDHINYYCGIHCSCVKK